MTQITTIVLTSLFAIGCGSGAMASPGPSYGQWSGAPPGYAAGYPSPPDPSAADPAVPIGDPPGPGPSPSEPTPPSPPDEESAPSPPQAQSAPQAPRDQDQEGDDDEDGAQRFAQPTGQRHLGVMVMGLTPELRRFFGVTSDRGVLVARVEPGSAAARAGVQVGDVLVRVGRQQVHTGNDVVQALDSHGGGRMRVAVVRQGRIVRLDATLPRARRAMPQQQGPIHEDPI
jgi:membrane-associated protease RseP (regulator of RpoE activity)